MVRSPLIRYYKINIIVLFSEIRSMSKPAGFGLRPGLISSFRWPVLGGQFPVDTFSAGQFPVASSQWPVPTGQISVASFRWPVFGAEFGAFLYT